jgi:hypothetical protein
MANEGYVEDWEEYNREQEKKEAEPYHRYGFKSKVTDMSEGKGNLQKQKKQKKPKNFPIHPKKKPSVQRYIPHPVEVSAEHAKRGGLIGIPENVDGLRPIRFFPPSDNEPRERDLLFGNVKRDKKGKVRLF